MLHTRDRNLVSRRGFREVYTAVKMPRTRATRNHIVPFVGAVDEREVKRQPLHNRNALKSHGYILRAVKDNVQIPY